MKSGSIQRLELISHCRRGNRILIAGKNIENHWIVKLVFFFFSPLFDAISKEWRGVNFWAQIEYWDIFFYSAVWYLRKIKAKTNFNRFDWLIHFRFPAKHVRFSDGFNFFSGYAEKISFLHLNAKLKPFNWMEKKRKNNAVILTKMSVEMDEFSSFLIICYYIRLRKFFNRNSFNTAKFSSYSITLNEKAFNQIWTHETDTLIKRFSAIFLVIQNNWENYNDFYEKFEID